MRATLRDHHPRLEPGACLAFVERVSPTTGEREDADRRHRHVVRLTAVTLAQDPSGQLFDDPPIDGPTDVTMIEWSAEDALPFPLCLSARAFPRERVSEAWGNIVLADHGRTVEENADRSDPAWQVPRPSLFTAPSAGAPRGCDPPVPQPVPPRFGPVLAGSPLAFGFDLAAMLAVPMDDDDEGWASAARFATLAARDAVPLIALESLLATDTDTWTAQGDLLGSAAAATDFVVEVDDARRAHLRFGNDAPGQAPRRGHGVSCASYRVGNGSAGNVGAMALTHVVSTDTAAFVALANPMPAFGGTEPEDVEAARRDAPQAFRTQERAVTAADYAAAAERRSEVQRAAATFRWTGSWHTVFVTADRVGGARRRCAFRAPAAAASRTLPHGRLRPRGRRAALRGARRRAARLRAARPFPRPGAAALREVLSASVRADGQLGLFHPDHFSFGEPVYLSPIVAAAQAVEGRRGRRPKRFQRLARPDPTTLANGVIPIGRLEVAQLADDPNFRERGRLEIDDRRRQVSPRIEGLS